MLDIVIILTTIICASMFSLIWPLLQLRTKLIQFSNKAEQVSASLVISCKITQRFFPLLGQAMLSDFGSARAEAATQKSGGREAWWTYCKKLMHQVW